jgi:hypothetical protein
MAGNTGCFVQGHGADDRELLPLPVFGYQTLLDQMLVHANPRQLFLDALPHAQPPLSLQHKTQLVLAMKDTWYLEREMCPTVFLQHVIQSTELAALVEHGRLGPFLRDMVFDAIIHRHEQRYLEIRRLPVRVPFEEMVDLLWQAPDALAWCIQHNPEAVSTDYIIRGATSLRWLRQVLALSLPFQIEEAAVQFIVHGQLEALRTLWTRVNHRDTLPAAAITSEQPLILKWLLNTIPHPDVVSLVERAVSVRSLEMTRILREHLASAGQDLTEVTIRICGTAILDDVHPILEYIIPYIHSDWTYTYRNVLQSARVFLVRVSLTNENTWVFQYFMDNGWPEPTDDHRLPRWARRIVRNMRCAIVRSALRTMPTTDLITQFL